MALFLLVIGVISASAVLSMIEAALLSLPLLKARMLYEQERQNAKFLLFLKENIHVTIACIVVVNNAVNIAGSIFIGQKVTSLFGNQWLGIAAFLLTLLVILFGEVVPKTIGERHKIGVALFFARPVRILVWLLSPIVKLLLQFERPLKKHFHSRLPKVTEQEIKIMLRLGRDEGTVEMDEEMLCNRVFRLNDLRAFQMMKPFDQIYALPAEKTLAELKDNIIGSRYSRIAVYDKDPHDIVGIVQQRILLREIAKDNYTAKVKDFMVSPIFVNHLMKADALLEKFQAYHQHLFIVQDSSGKDIGLITMEDVLEELFGEIYDEKDISSKTPSSL